MSIHKQVFVARAYLPPELADWGVCRPLFFQEDSATPYISVVDNNKILAFQKLEESIKKVSLSNDGKIEALSGGAAIWVFLPKEGETFYGTLQDIEPQLKIQLKQNLTVNPYVALQLAEILNDKTATKSALEAIISGSEHRLPNGLKKSYIASFARDIVWQHTLDSIQDVEHRLGVERQINLIQVSIKAGGHVVATDLSEGRFANENIITEGTELATESLKKYIFEDKYGRLNADQGEVESLKEAEKLPILEGERTFNDATMEEIYSNAKKIDANLLNPLMNIARAKYQETRFALVIFLMLERPKDAINILKIYRDSALYANRMLEYLDEKFILSEYFESDSLDEFIAENVNYFCRKAYYGNRGRLLLEMARILRSYKKIASAIKLKVTSSDAFDINYLHDEILSSLRNH